MSIVSHPRILLDNVVERKQAAHVTLSIARITDDLYEVHSATKKQGSHLVDTVYSLDEARELVEELAEDIVTRLHAKRGKSPTPGQLATIFSFGMIIHPTLTFGEASDIISEKLAEIYQERNRKQEQKAQERRALLHLVNTGAGVADDTQ